jgi:hypothetical protein
MTSIRVVGARAFGLAALDHAFGQRATTHAFWFSPFCSEVAEHGRRQLIVQISISRQTTPYE